jgi:hypothetical protein
MEGSRDTVGGGWTVEQAMMTYIAAAVALGHDRASPRRSRGPPDFLTTRLKVSSKLRLSYRKTL